MNIVYPESSYNSDDYKCSIMINIVRRNALDMKQLRFNLQSLIKYGATLDKVDSLGRDLIMHATM